MMDYASDLIVRHKPGRLMDVPDQLSRNADPNKTIRENIMDESSTARQRYGWRPVTTIEEHNKETDNFEEEEAQIEAIIRMTFRTNTTANIRNVAKHKETGWRHEHPPERP